MVFAVFYVLFVLTANCVQLLHFWKTVGRNERKANDTFHKKASTVISFLQSYGTSQST